MAKETDAIDYLKGYLEGKKAGIREVVEWVKSLCWERERGEGVCRITETEFRSKLEDWGTEMSPVKRR